MDSQLSELTRYIFGSEDDPILDYLDDDGTLVEPIYYVPIIPMILVNGSKGIGTGFSTEILCYNPEKIINYLCDYLQNKELNYTFVPYYRGFNGEINEVSEHKYLVSGCYTIKSNEYVHITELPIGTWTDDYKKYIETLISDQKSDIIDFNDLSTDTTVEFIIKFNKNTISKYSKDELIKLLKLSTTLSTTNMNAFDNNECLTGFKNPIEIINSFINIRKIFYKKRKDYLLLKLEKTHLIYKNKCKYIYNILNDVIDLRKKSKQEIISILNKNKFDVIDDDVEFKYLLKMPMDSVSQENIDDLTNKLTNIEFELNKLKTLTINQLWLNDLLELKESLFMYW